jgi:O-antigen ligase/Flp pilus assembly protein TadD
MLKASRATFILLLLFAPLAFGSVEPWAFFFLVLLTGASLLFYFVHCLPAGRPFYQIPGLVPLALVGALLVLQLIPLPDSVLALVSPRSLLFRQKTAGLFAANNAWPISLDLGGGLYELSRFLVCCGCYVLSIQLLSDGKMFKRTVLILSFFGGLLALSSILQFIFTVDRILWLRHLPVHSSPFGPYVNRNHYAGLMEMLFPLALALACALRPSRQFGSRREKILGFFDDDDFLLFILLCFSAVLMALSVFMSLSRGGIFSLCLSLLFFVLVASRTVSTGRKTRFVPITAILVCATVMAVSWFGWDKVESRFSQLETEIGAISPASRHQILKNSLNMVTDFPLAGAGFGSFRNVFPKYHNLPLYGVLEHAHNDYLQLLAEGGIVGVILLLIFFAGLFRATFRTLKKRVEPYAVFVCLGAATGLLAIFSHSAADFNLHINANTLYFAFLCALAVSAAHTRFRPNLVPGTYLVSYKTNKRWVLPGVMVLLWIPLLVFSAGQWAGAFYTGPFKHIRITGGTDPAVRDQMEKSAARASRLDPFEASYRVMAGDAAFAARNFTKALAAYQEAIILVPTCSEFLQKAALAAYYANKDIKQADALMSAGVEFYPAQPVFYARYAAFLLKTDRPAAARDIIRKGIALEPARTDMFFDIMRDGKMTPAEMYIALADNSYVWARFAAYIEKTDYSFMRKEILEKAVTAAGREEKPSAAVYSSLAGLWVKENDYDQAIMVLEKGVAKLPDQTGLLYDLAMLYEHLRITYKAAELYKKVLIINPGHKNARARLENLGKP